MSSPYQTKDVSGIEKCIQSCIDGCRVCQATMLHCLEQGGVLAQKTHIQMLLECAELCKFAAESMIMETGSSGKICAICAEVCEICAQHCRNIDEDDLLDVCAETCAKCAESCRAMAE